MQISKLLIIPTIFYLILLTFYVAHSLKLDTGFPKGYDTVGHVSQVEFVRKNFPNIFWNPYWYTGSVFFPSGYPPLYHHSLGLIAKISGISSSDLVRDISIFSLVLIAICFFLIAYLLIDNLLFSLALALGAFSTPALWSFIIQFGLQIRLFAMAMYCLNLVAILAFIKGKDKKFTVLKKSFESNLLLVPLLVVSFMLVVLSHLFIGLLAFITLTFMLFNFGFARHVQVWLKTVFISFGLGAFYFIPYLILKPVRLAFFAITDDPVYKAIKFKSIYGFAYPGLPLIFFSVLVLFFLITFFVKKSEWRALGRGFYFFLGLGFIFLVYGLKGGIYVMGIYTSHVPFFAAFFLGLSSIFGLGYILLPSLNAEHKKAKGFLQNERLIFVLSGLAFVYLNYQVFDLDRILKQIATNSVSSQNLGAIDETKNYRFAHLNEEIGAVFNIKYDALQTRGYFSQAILYPDINYWFENSVFGQGNSPASKFLLDWYGIDQVYLSSRVVNNLARASYESDTSAFAKDGNSFSYVGKTPIFLASDAPYVFVNATVEDYEMILKEVAKMGFSLDRIIPVLGRGVGKDGLSVSSLDEVKNLPFLTRKDKFHTSGQELKATEKNNGSHWEMVLDRAFKGLVFKQSFFQNWHAKIIDEQGKSKGLKVLMAGPGVMYVILPTELKTPAKVVFDYKHSWSEYLGLFVSLGTIVWVVAGIKRRIVTSYRNI